MRDIIRKRICFYGSVQGVGFRFRAKRAADIYGCTGWVRNEWNGSVTMEIQGEAEAINHVIESLNRSLYIRIERMEAKTLPTDEKESSFRTEMDY